MREVCGNFPKSSPFCDAIAILMLNRHIKRGGVVYYRVDKRKAREEYGKGRVIYITACNKGNANHPYPIIPMQAGLKFDLAVLSYKVNNCNGNCYPAFYIKEENSCVSWDTV